MRCVDCKRVFFPVWNSMECFCDVPRRTEGYDQFALCAVAMAMCPCQKIVFRVMPKGILPTNNAGDDAFPADAEDTIVHIDFIIQMLIDAENAQLQWDGRCTLSEDEEELRRQEWNDQFWEWVNTLRMCGGRLRQTQALCATWLVVKEVRSAA